jgi:hypothetical protein
MNDDQDTESMDSLGGPALQAFFKLADIWELTPKEQMILLGVSARSTFYKWKQNQDIHISRDTIERVSYLLGIYKSLQILLPGEQAADEWLRKPNSAPLFGGGSALDRMMGGNVSDLYVVRNYLDAELNG